MKVLIAGDAFLGGDLSTFSGSTIKFQSYYDADFRFINLEQAISDESYVTNKCTLFTGSEALNRLSQLKVNAVNLANNHIHDKGLDGIEETINNLDSIGIEHIGAGGNIEEARKALYLGDNVCILSYCDYGQPTLNDIAIAQDNVAGVNPLRIESILSDLKSLKSDEKAIIYFHWGAEHLSLPSVRELEITKTLLERDDVIAVIGMHAHRVLGKVMHKNKPGYMCLGNFLFPNFYISPPSQIFYPNPSEIESVNYTTYRYLEVFRNTYKKWRLINRISLVLTFDTETYEFKERFVYQKSNSPEILELKGLFLLVFKFRFRVLSMFYKCPKLIYSPIRNVYFLLKKYTWLFFITLEQSKQVGLKKAFFPLIKKVLKC